VTLLGALAALLLGLALGAGYFGGLWWTLAALPRWRRPGVALLLSFVVRGAIAVAAFVLLARAGLAPLALAFAGFLAARMALVAWWRPARLRPDGPAHGAADGRVDGRVEGRVDGRVDGRIGGGDGRRERRWGTP
jgi:F1F0 ATPase subunit 2